MCFNKSKNITWTEISGNSVANKQMRDPEIPLNQVLNLVELSLMYTLRDDKVSALRALCRHDTQSGRTYSHTLQCR